MEEQKTGIEIDVAALLGYLFKRAAIIFGAACLFGAAGCVWNLFFVTPQYTATTSIYILNRSNSNAIASSDFQISNYMISDYRELIKGRNLTAEVIEMLSLQMSSDALSAKISVSNPESTRIVQIRVTDPQPERAMEIANAVREVAITQLTEIMKVDAATTVYEAELPAGPSEPNVAKNTMLMAAMGLLLMLAIYSAIYIADKRIRTEADVERCLRLPTLGSIPDTQQHKKAKR